MSRIDQVRRIVFLREYLDAQPHFKPDEVADALGVSRRTLYRDLRLLRTAQSQLASFVPHHAFPARDRLDHFSKHEAAVALAVLVHDIHFDKQSSHGQIWTKVRVRIAEFVRHQTRNLKIEVDDQLEMILDETMHHTPDDRSIPSIRGQAAYDRL